VIATFSLKRSQVSAAAAALAAAERDLDLDLRIPHRGRVRFVVGWIARAATGDADATVWAKQLDGGHDVKLWSGERFVLRLSGPAPE
jgi:hypothetical protein